MCGNTTKNNLTFTKVKLRGLGANGDGNWRDSVEGGWRGRILKEMTGKRVLFWVR